MSHSLLETLLELFLSLRLSARFVFDKVFCSVLQSQYLPSRLHDVYLTARRVFDQAFLYLQMQIYCYTNVLCGPDIQRRVYLI